MSEETHTSHGLAGGSVAHSGPEPAVSTAVLERLLEAVASALNLESAAGSLLAGVVELLGLSRASLALLADREGVTWLDPLAAAGEHAFLARDMPALPLDSSADASTAVSAGRPVLFGDVHGVGERAESDSGVGRWRTGMNAQAYAVLPLMWREKPVGVATVEWATPHPFDLHDYDTLEWIAASMAAAIGSFEAAEPSATVEMAVPEAPAARTRLVSLGFDAASGVTYFEPEARAAAPELRVTVAVAEPGHDRSAAFWDLVEGPTGEAFVFAGVALAPAGGAPLLAERARQTLRASVLGGVEPAVALAVLAQWARATAQAGGTVSAAVVRVDSSYGAICSALSGSAALAFLGRDGRFVLDDARSGSRVPEEAASRPTLERTMLALPGDRVALTASAAPPPEALLEVAGARDAHVGALARGAAEAVELLVRQRQDAGEAGVAMVIDVLRLGGEPGVATF